MLDFFRDLGLDHAAFRLAPAALWLVFLWWVETCGSIETHGVHTRRERFRHGGTNLAIAALNGTLLFFSVGLFSVYVCGWSPVESSQPIRIGVAFVALDLFSYLWHRANHRFPVLWRFHAVHHSDAAMDVTTSGRFHVAELGMAAIVRLPLLYILGVSTIALLTYETALVVVSMLHHSRVKLGRFDPLLRLVLVTPSIHSVHHSRDPELYGCNYSSVLSVWDRLFRTFRLSTGPVQHGLDGHEGGQSVWGLLSSPFHSAGTHGTRKRD